MTLPKETCSICRFWHGENKLEPQYGACRCGMPDSSGEFPSIRPDEWCGNFEHADLEMRAAAAVLLIVYHAANQMTAAEVFRREMETDMPDDNAGVVLSIVPDED